MPVPPTRALTTSTQSPPQGTSWTVTGTNHRTATGKGSDAGTWTRDASYTDTFVVIARTDTTTTISWSETGSWSSTATQTWVSANGGATNKGTISSTVIYTIDLGTYKVTTVSDTDYSDQVGHPSWILINPTTPTAGGTVQGVWYVPNSDATSSTLTDVPWTVSKSSVNVKGTQVGAWKGTYTGDGFGWWRSGNVHSKGSETDTQSFDSTYGTYLAGSFSGNFAFTRTGGGWTETFTESDNISDTNLTFSVPVSVTAPTGATITVDGVAVTGTRAFTWDPASTHTLTVNGTVQGATGVRYVFVQWDDGTTQTTRTITAQQPGNYTATFRTQYQLTVNSDIGNPQGAGWYDAGTEATFSVTTPQPESGFLGSLGGKVTFQSWTGDSTSTAPSANVSMDAPKTVQAKWTTDDSQAYMILGGIAAALVVVGVVVVLLLKRGRAAAPSDVKATTITETEPKVEAPPVKTKVAAAAQKPLSGTKYCVYCGATIPASAKFCTEIDCGKQQR
jgi:hypothetical protein